MGQSVVGRGRESELGEISGEGVGEGGYRSLRVKRVTNRCLMIF